MKILQVIFNLSPGGAERFVVDLSNELSKEKDNEVVILTLMDDKVDPEKRKFYCFDLDNKVTYKNLGLTSERGFKFSTLWAVYKAIRTEHADVIHLHTATIVNFCILAICLLCWNTPIIQTIHTDFKVGHSTKVYKFLFKVLGRLKKMSWIALSQTNFNDMMSTYPYINGIRIDNGRAPIMATEKYDNVTTELKELRTSPNSKIYLHVARCIAVKNQIMLVKAFNEFARIVKNADLVIIGANFDSELGKEIKEVSGNNIHFLGTRKNISDYMLQADVFCLSSSYEGLPITLLEAMLAGIPIVCTPIAAANDVLSDGNNAIISTDFSTESYTRSLLDSFSKLDRLKISAFNMRENSPYTIHECAKKYMNFYRQCSND